MEKNIKKELLNIKEEADNKLTIAVIDDILNMTDTDEEIISYMNNVINHGCISGVVSSLIYYSDTEKFFKEYAEEIFDLMNEYKENCGEYPNIELNSNNLAWFGYETICYELFSQLEE